MAYLSKLFALERGGGDYKLDKSNLIAPYVNKVHAHAHRCTLFASRARPALLGVCMCE